MPITNVVGRGGKVMSSKFQATLIGGPYLLSQLKKLELAVSGEACIQSVKAMGRVVADEWSARVPVDDGEYRDEMKQPDVVHAGPVKGHDPESLGVLLGASGSVAPRLRPGLAGVEPVNQPARYAAVLEFGGRIGERGQVGGSLSRRNRTGAWHHAEPSARPAFDASRERAVEAAKGPLLAAVNKVAP